jgi:hypothetical protein
MRVPSVRVPAERAPGFSPSACAGQPARESHPSTGTHPPPGRPPGALLRALRWRAVGERGSWPPTCAASRKSASPSRPKAVHEAASESRSPRPRLVFCGIRRPSGADVVEMAGRIRPKALRISQRSERLFSDNSIRARSASGKQVQILRGPATVKRFCDPRDAALRRGHWGRAGGRPWRSCAGQVLGRLGIGGESASQETRVDRCRRASWNGPSADCAARRFPG